ncbi:hypothetical protein AB0I89_23820 [Micromonospora sp. NPDC049801]|uniref:hypothetical protein n=1 Tax=unclassified Micromonospora TaxID=2617518 RepID=UPI0033C58517
MRRIAVQFVAELAKFKRDMRDGATEVRRMRDEAKATQAEVSALGRAGDDAGRRLGDGLVRGADGRLRNARGRFAAAGQAGGRVFGDSFTRDALGRLRSADGRFASEGRRLGSSASRGVAGSLGSVSSGGRAFLILAGGASAASAALQGVPPVLTAIGGSLAAIPGLAAGAAASLATLALGGVGVGSAIGEVFNPPARGGGGGGGGGGRDNSAANARAIASAERGLAHAQRESRLAQLDVNRARREATRELRDMRIALGRVALDEREAALSLEEAQAELNHLREVNAESPGLVPEGDMRRAELAYDEAVQSMTEVSVRAKDLREDQSAAAKAGVEGSEQVQSALRRQQDAAEAVIDATDALAAARESAAAAGGGASGGAAAAATAYDKLSKNAKLFVDEIARIKPQLVGLQQLAQDRVFAGLNTELRDAAQVALPFARKQVIRFGDTWNDTFTQVLRLGRDKRFLTGLDAALASSDRFFDKVNARIPATGQALAHLFTGSAPFVDAFGDSLLQYVDDFNAWVDRSARNGNLEAFFADAAEQADALLDLTREVFVLVGRIGGMRQGSTLLRDMADAVAKFNDEAHDMRSVEGIVATGNAAIKGTVEVLLVLGETLGETLADPGTRAAVELFFDVLKVGAQTVGELAELFSHLPDGVQAVILAGAALTILGSRVVTVFGRAQDAVGKFSGKLGGLGPAGAVAGRGLESTTKWAGRAAGAFIALQAAGVVFDQFRAAAPDVERLTKALQEYAVSGKVTGEATRIFGDDLGDVGQDVRAAGDSWFPKLGRAIESIMPGARELNEVFWGGSWTGSAENVKALDESLARLVETSGKTASFEAWNRILSESGMNADELIKLFPAYEQALKDADMAAGSVGAKQQLLNGSVQDAMTTMGSYTRAWQTLNGVQLDADEAALSAIDAIDDVREAFKRNKDTVAGNSRAAIENRIAVGRAAQAAAEAAQKRYDETQSVQEATAAYNGHVNILRGVLQQTNLTDAEIEALLASLAKMPPLKQTAVSAPGATAAKKQVEDFNFVVKTVPPSKTVPFWANTTEAKAAIAVLKAKIDELKNQKIYVEGSVRWTSSGDLKVPGGTIRRDRWGGVHEGPYAKAATGLLREAAVFTPRNPGRYMIAEPETQGEAFIPKVGDRDRAISIGRRAMEWHGMAVVPRSAITGQPYQQSGGGGQVQVSQGDTHVYVEIDGQQLEGRIVRVVRDRDRDLKRRVGAGAGR